MNQHESQICIKIGSMKMKIVHLFLFNFMNDYCKEYNKIIYHRKHLQFLRFQMLIK